MNTCNKTDVIKTPDVYKCTFNAYSKTVVSIFVKAYSVIGAIKHCEDIFGEETVVSCLVSVELTCPF